MLYKGSGEVIHSNQSGVDYSTMEEQVFSKLYNGEDDEITNYAYLKVLGNPDVNAVIDFAEDKIGREYDWWSLPFGGHCTKQVDPPAGHPGYGYYCAELPWASYMHATDGSINLDPNDRPNGPWWLRGIVSPTEIYKSDHTYRFYIYDPDAYDAS
jgi:uncharacterized protein YycO